MTLTGPITFTGLSSGSLTVTFDHFNYTADAAADPNQIMLDGNLTSSCLGTTVAYATDSPILLVPSDVCPSGGELALTYLGNSERLVFGDGGSVGLDLNNDGSIDEAFDSCSATQLFLCRSVETP